MDRVEPSPRHSFGAPGLYEIVARGHVTASDVKHLSGMELAIADDPNYGPISILVGRLKDQTQLNGVLNTLYEMHLSIISVRSRGPEDPPPIATDKTAGESES